MLPNPARAQIAQPPPSPAVTLWLIVCCAMIFAMALIGAITRLTESGLSIMEWAPISGILPPLSEAEWQRLFALYQQTDEFRIDNASMTLESFREIFWWEYIHRLWGRLIGLVYALPFFWFLWRGALPGWLKPHAWFLLFLGGLQGAMGWYMVESGFGARTDVSQYRLVLHLSLALAIYGYLLWLVFRITEEPPQRAARSAALGGWLRGLLALAGLTIVSGGFVAGLNAGLIYNSFPLMDGRLVPEDYLSVSPFWLNWFETIAAVQFNHRLLATLTVVATAALWLWSWRLPLRPGQRLAMHFLVVAVTVQFLLGIATLLAVVPISLAVLHQAGAIALLSFALLAVYRIRTAVV